METKLPLNPEQLQALDKLLRLAIEKINSMPQDFHNEEFKLLGHVPNWVAFVKENHTNPYAELPVKSCLSNLRKVVVTLKFDLK